MSYHFTKLVAYFIRSKEGIISLSETSYHITKVFVNGTKVICILFQTKIKNISEFNILITTSFLWLTMIRFHESILPNLFSSKTHLFPFFAIKRGHFKVKICFFICYKHSSLTAKIEKRRKTKFGRIGFSSVEVTLLIEKCDG